MAEVFNCLKEMATQIKIFIDVMHSQPGVTAVWIHPLLTLDPQGTVGEPCPLERVVEMQHIWFIISKTL